MTEGTGTTRFDGSGARPFEETSLYGFMSVILRYRGMVAVLMLVFAAYGTLKLTERKPLYATRFALTVDARPDQTSELRSLTASETGREVAFFSELLRSRLLLLRIAAMEYSATDPDGTVRGPLARHLGLPGDPGLHAERVYEYLARHVTITGSGRSGNIWVFVNAPHPEVARQIALNLVSELEEYSLTRKKAQAKAEREFIEERLVEARADLRSAENQLLEFRVSNRDLSSPSLDLAHARLQRGVTEKQSLYTSLLQSLDRARIEEARDRPSIAVLEAPELPVEPEPSSAFAFPILGAIAGLLLAIVIAFIRERFAETKAAQSPAFSQYVELRQQALNDLKNPLRPIRRAISQRSDG